MLDETVSSSGVAVDKLSVLTYNILCDRYATSSQYGYVPSVALSWDYRKELIMQEIRAQNADIVCLQEVDADNYSEYFRVQLAYDDYKGVFWPKSRARTMPEKEARSVDGCATLFKHHKWVSAFFFSSSSGFPASGLCPSTYAMHQSGEVRRGC